MILYKSIHLKILSVNYKKDQFICFSFVYSVKVFYKYLNLNDKETFLVFKERIKKVFNKKVNQQRI